VLGGAARGREGVIKSFTYTDPKSLTARFTLEPGDKALATGDIVWVSVDRLSDMGFQFSSNGGVKDVPVQESNAPYVSGTQCLRVTNEQGNLADNACVMDYAHGPGKLTHLGLLLTAPIPDYQDSYRHYGEVTRWDQDRIYRLHVSLKGTPGV